MLEPSSSEVVQQRRKKRGVVTASTEGTKYDLVRRCIGEMGMQCLPDEDANSHAYLIWSDSVVQADRVQDLKCYQRINHFPGMAEICRKDYLARNMAKMSRAKPEEYHFVPRTWILPSEYNLLVLYWKDMKKKVRKPQTFIMKPSNGAMGNGIYLFRNPERLVPHEQMIVQEYLDRPFLLDDYKIDLRLYVLVTQCDPLRVFLYDDGLVRLSTEKYASPSEANVDSLYMHLTNYSVNKYNDNFKRDADSSRGSKRSIKSFMNFLSSKGYDTKSLWKKIIDLVVKTLIVASPHILHSYRMSRPGQPAHSDSLCFEILGFDVLLDRKLNPWLLEVNRSPSFGADENVDRDIKSGVVKDALRLLNIRPSDKSRSLARQKVDARRRLLRPSYKHVAATSGLSTATKRQAVFNRRKQELKEKLVWARKNATREEYEDKNMNNYIRIFPSSDIKQQNRYLELLHESFSLFLRIRSAPFQKSIIDQFKHQREDEILDLLQQCEAEEMGDNPKALQHPQPLSSMPELLPPPSRSFAGDYSDSSKSSSSSDDEPNYVDRGGRRTIEKRSSKLHPKSDKLMDQVHWKNKKSSSPTRARSASLGRSQTGPSVLTRPSTAFSAAQGDGKRPTNSARHRSQIDKRSVKRNGIVTENSQRTALIETYLNSYSDARRKLHHNSKKGKTLRHEAHNDFLAAVTKERELELYARTLTALLNARIKFPGKSDAEAELILNDIMENWKVHKSQVASYWLIKLDAVKRQKVIDIVIGNVRAVIQRIWMVSDVHCLKIMRTFTRVFNLMHANHGQGLWSCFSASGNSWETMFSKSRESLSVNELNCCRRIVQLCKDCLLIVYKFAGDAHQSSLKSPPVILQKKPHFCHKQNKHFNPHGAADRSRFKASSLTLQAESGAQESVSSTAFKGELYHGMAALQRDCFQENVSVENRPKVSSEPLIFHNLPRRFMKSTSLHEPASPYLGDHAGTLRGGLLASFQRS